jgi:hypothetical protein
LAEHHQSGDDAGGERDEQRDDHDRLGGQITREEEADHRHQQDGQHAEHPIHEDGGHRRGGRHLQARQAVSADRGVADARREKRPDERADEEDPHDGPERDVRGGRERSQQDQPPVGIQCAIHQDEEHRQEDPAPFGAARDAPDLGRVSFPQDERGEAGGNEEADESADRAGRHCALERESRCREGSRLIR